MGTVEILAQALRSDLPLGEIGSLQIAQGLINRLEALDYKIVKIVHVEHKPFYFDDSE